MKEFLIFPFICFILGAIVMHIWDRFKNRIACLRYTVWHRYLAATADDPRFGSVKVLYNNNPVASLYMTTAIISNENNKDLSNFDINIVCDQDSAILISYGRNTGSLNELEFTDKYTDLLIKQQPENMPQIFGRRDYKIPVLNRNGKIEFALLITNFKGRQPFITLSCDYPGVKMKYAKVSAELLGESLILSSLWGSILAIFLCVFIIFFISNKVTAVLMATLVSLFASLIGVLFIKTYKAICKVFG